MAAANKANATTQRATETTRAAASSAAASPGEKPAAGKASPKRSSTQKSSPEKSSPKKSAGTKVTATAGAKADKAKSPDKAKTKAQDKAKAPDKGQTKDKGQSKDKGQAKGESKKSSSKKADKGLTTKQKAARLVVRENEAPWTKAELKEIRKGLEEEAATLSAEIANSEREIQGLIRDGSDGAGDDQADAGAKTLEREHEITLANNAREILLQSERALAQIDAGTYGICENCGSPIGKARLQAQPRATLCLSCKAKQERR